MPPRSLLTASIVTSISCPTNSILYYHTLHAHIISYIYELYHIISYHIIYTQLHILDYTYTNITYTLHTHYIYITYILHIHYIHLYYIRLYYYIILTNDSNYCYHSFKLGQRVKFTDLRLLNQWYILSVIMLLHFISLPLIIQQFVSWVTILTILTFSISTSCYLHSISILILYSYQYNTLHIFSSSHSNYNIYRFLLLSNLS